MQTHIEDLAERWSNEFNRSDIRNLAILVIDIPSNQVGLTAGMYISTGNKEEIR